MSYTRDSSEDLIYNSETGQYEPVPTSVILTIIPIPSDATVTFSTGTVSGNTCTVEKGTSVTYTVSKEHYNTESDTVIVNADTSITITLAETLYTYTINPTPSDATVTLTATEYTQSGNSILVPYNTTVNWSVSKDNYTTRSGTKTIIETTTDNITLNLKPCTLNIVPTPSDATVILTATGYSQQDNSIIVPYGTTVSYEVSKEGYVSQSNTINVVSDITLPISLAEIQCIITVNPDPADATVILTAQGYTQVGNTITVNYGTPVSVDISKDNYNSMHLDLTSAEVIQDITLTPTLTRSHYILTVNTTPLDAIITFSTGTISQDGHSCTVPAGTTVDYTVSKTKYISQSFSAVMNSDKTVNVTLAKQTYTLTINTTPENTLKQLYINGSTTPITIASSYVAEVDTSIRYVITKFGFIKVDDSLILDSDVTLDITLDEGFLVKDLDAATVFANNTNITSVNLNYKPWVNNSMSHAFSNCSSLEVVTNISNSVVNLQRTFYNCINLTSVSALPNICDGNLGGTFRECRSIQNIPALPNSVIGNMYSMGSTFYNCVNLVNAPEIPEWVKTLDNTFYNCTNLTNIPTIPNSVNFFGGVFDGCVNLAGNIYINSMNITDATNCFANTSLTKNVYIPFTYENSINTVTYNAFTTAGYDTRGTQHGVYLKDINAPITYLNVEDYSYTSDVNNNITLTTYVGTNTSVIAPELEER